MNEFLNFKVFYCYQPNAEQQGKSGFGQAFKWDVDLLSGYNYEFLENVSPKPSSSYFLGCNTPQIGNRITNYGASHIIVFGWHLKSFHQALSFANKNSIPIAVRGDSILDNKTPFYKRLIKKLYYPFFLNKFNSFLSVGKRNAEYLKYYGIKKGKIIFSPHAVDQEYWNSGKQNKKTCFVFLWVAKFIPLKRPQDAINAFLKVKEMANCKLQMVGTGELLEEMKVLAKDCSQIEFLGFQNQSQLKDIYKNSNALLLTSDSETWGLVVNESLASKTPAIVSDVCGCVPDLIDPLKSFSYRCGDVEELASKMRDIYDLKEEKKSQLEMEITALNEKYSFASIKRSFEEFVKEDRERIKS